LSPATCTAPLTPLVLSAPAWQYSDACALRYQFFFVASDNSWVPYSDPSAIPSLSTYWIQGSGSSFSLTFALCVLDLADVNSKDSTAVCKVRFLFVFIHFLLFSFFSNSHDQLSCIHFKFVNPYFLVFLPVLSGYFLHYYNYLHNASILFNQSCGSSLFCDV